MAERLPSSERFRDKDILDREMHELRFKLRLAVKALQFYGDESNTFQDKKEYSADGKYVGPIGRKARICLEDMKR